MVQTVLNDTRLTQQTLVCLISSRLSESYLLLVRLLAFGVLRGSLQDTSLLLLLGLGTILVGKLEELSGSILVESVRELGDRRWDFQALVEDDLLTLEANVLGPLDEASQVLLRLDILAWIHERSVIIPPCRVSVLYERRPLTDDTHRYQSS